MIHIRFIADDQSHKDIQTKPGRSLMKAAVDAGVVGIAADCGGSLTCIRASPTMAANANRPATA